MVLFCRASIEATLIGTRTVIYALTTWMCESVVSVRFLYEWGVCRAVIQDIVVYITVVGGEEMWVSRDNTRWSEAPWQKSVTRSCRSVVGNAGFCFPTRRCVGEYIATFGKEFVFCKHDSRSSICVASLFFAERCPWWNVRKGYRIQVKCAGLVSATNECE